MDEASFKQGELMLDPFVEKLVRVGVGLRPDQWWAVAAKAKELAWAPREKKVRR
jgi:hypothetical protein